jgi:hypothetical protein
MVWFTDHYSEDASMKTWNSHRATKIAMLWAVGCWGLPGVLQANAPGYTYGVDVDNGFLTGTITTSCDQCILDSSNITGWALASTATPAPFSVASTDPGAFAGFAFPDIPTSLTANPAAITYDFAQAGQFIFQNNNEFVLLGYSHIGADLMGFPGEIGVCSGSDPGTSSCVAELFRGGPTVLAEVRNVAAPELEATSLAGALTLLLGSLAVLRGRPGFRRGRKFSRVAACAGGEQIPDTYGNSYEWAATSPSRPGMDCSK